MRIATGEAVRMTQRPPALGEIAGAVRQGRARAGVAAVVAALAVLLTVIHLGSDWNGFAWAAAQVVLVFIAWFDVQTRRILNVVVLPLTATALLLRVAFERDELLACVLTGAAAVLAFLVLNIVTRGGLGMGDVKLAGAICVLLGVSGLTALVIGTVLGGMAALLMLARGATRRSSLAYAPYLCAGAVVVVLTAAPPPLV